MSAGRFDRRLIAPMVLGAVMNPINSSIIAVSLVPIGRAFGAPSSQTAWLISALYLATAIGQPVVGRLVDLYGPKRLLLAGAVLVGAGGLLGTVAPDLPVLVLARVVLGFGTCAGYPAAMSLIRRESERTGLESPSGVLTTLAVSSQTIAVVGPTLGGLLIGVGGWRATFAVNVPLAVAGFVVAAVVLPSPPAPRGVDRRRPDLDLPGIALFAATLVTLLVFLVTPEVGRLWLPALSVVSAAALTRRELRTADPFLDLRVLAGNVPLLLTYARMFLAMTVAYAFLYGFTQWTEDGRGLSATGAGLILLPLSATALGVSILTGRRPVIRGKLVVGSAAQLVGCSLLFVLDGSSPIWLLVVVAVVVGVPQGLNNLANQNALYHQADPDRLGASSGLLRTFGYLGAIVASAVNGLFFGATADTHGLHEVAIPLVVVAATFLVLSVTDRSLSRIGRPAVRPATASRTPEPATKGT